MSSTTATTFLFTDIEGSTRLWEQDPARMRPALARHDSLARATIEAHGGMVVKTTGDGVHAAFGDPVAAIAATLEFQRGLAAAAADSGIALQVRCGLHVGVDERRDNDFFGTAVNRAARLMSSAHGGQILISNDVASLVAPQLPPEVTLVDLGTVRLRDLMHPERVYQVAHPQLRRDFPPLRSLEATPNNLPLQITSFVGRERAVAEARTLLATSRLVTLTGTGGLGKTRLALEVAVDVLDDYPDGVWFIDLAPLRDARLVPQAIATVVGIKEEAGRPVMEALLKHVRERSVLLVLDNCEHLVDASAELATTLLAHSSGLRILATSREYLRVRGESGYAVPAMSIPDVASPLSVSAILLFEAVRLFVERAIAARPAFVVTPQNAPAIAAICRRLDGVPLALELAAARMRTLSIEQIAKGLDDRFRLLVRGHRTDLPRQQTLRALIDWSHDLLSPSEQAVLRRLSVFAGGWRMDAAEAVVGDASMVEVQETLSALVEKSLVVFDADRDRYRYLETMREYAHERLEQSSDGISARTRHLHYFVALGDRARGELEGPEQAACLARLDLELENLLAAHAWAAHAEDGVTLGLQLVTSVKMFWISRGLLELGHRVTVEALNRTDSGDRSLVRCRGLLDAGQYCYFMGRHGDARAYLERVLLIARELANAPMMAAILQPLGMACLGQGDNAEARRNLEEAVSIATESANKRSLVFALNALAQLHRAEGDLDRAEPLCERVLTLAMALGEQESIAVGLLNVAMVAIDRGAADRANALLVEVFAIADATGSKTAAQSALEAASGLAALRGDAHRAARIFGAAEMQTTRTGLRRDPADEHFLAPLVARARDTLGPTAFAAAEAAGRALAYDDALAETREWLRQAA